MRYYSIQIGDGTTYESHPGGVFDPGALNVEIDISVTQGAIPLGGSMVRVWGIGLDTISQAQNFNMQTISVYGGMMPGLPLATLQSPEQGLLCQGTIYPAFGNWILTDMTLDLIIIPGTSGGGPDQPANLVHNMPAGTKMADAVTQALTTAFPTLTPVVNIADNLILNYADVGFYQNFDQYAKYIKDLSSSIYNQGQPFASGSYLGVHMAQVGNNIVVSDGTKSATNQKTINFYDLIGQPTWIGLNTVQVKTVMRGDISVSDQVTLPPSLATQTAASSTQNGTPSQSGFQGTFQVQKVRHIGNFRQPDGMSWNSTFDCVAMNTAGG